VYKSASKSKPKGKKKEKQLWTERDVLRLLQAGADGDDTNDEISALHRDLQLHARGVERETNETELRSVQRCIATTTTTAKKKNRLCVLDQHW
jgi:hypothetical protein